MKYILLEHADGNDPKVLRIFDTPEARAQATRNAILGDPDGDIMAIECPELDTLAQCGIVHFEGDPPLEWIDAVVPDATPAPVVPPANEWAVETMLLINKLTPDIKGKAFDPDWFLLRQRLESVVPRADAEALATALQTLAVRARYDVDCQPARIALAAFRARHPAPKEPLP